MSGRVQRFLVEGRGADALRQTRLHHLHGFLDIAIRRLAGRRRHLPNGRSSGTSFKSKHCTAFDEKSASPASLNASTLSGTPTIRPAVRRRLASPITSAWQIACVPGSASAFMMTSGPMPAGSPMVIAMVGRLM